MSLEGEYGSLCHRSIGRMPSDASLVIPTRVLRFEVSGLRHRTPVRPVLLTGPSHEWRLAEAAPSSRDFQWFTRKPLGSLVDPQSQAEELKTKVQ
jgi:hypothetical protein